MIMSWEEETKKLAKESGIPAAQICSDLRFDRSWYNKWMAGKIPDPGVNRIQKLHDYLSRK
jgi:transcriptional regulator with XRE-family HTH domain